MTNVATIHPRTLVVLGAGGHGRVVADIARCLGCYENVLFLDDSWGAGSQDSRRLKVIGPVSVAGGIPNAEYVVAVGSSFVREKLTCELEAKGLRLATLVHPSAVVSPDAVLGRGTVVMPGAVVAPGAVVGRGCIINTCSSVDHDCFVGDWSHIAVGAHVAGTVQIGSYVWVGAGAIVINDLTVCSRCTIGAGCVVVKSLDAPGTYVGVPAKMVNGCDMEGGR